MQLINYIVPFPDIYYELDYMMLNAIRNAQLLCQLANLRAVTLKYSRMNNPVKVNRNQ